MNETSLQELEPSPLSQESSIPISAKPNPTEELKAFNQIVSSIQAFDDEAKARIFHSVLTFLGIVNTQLRGGAQSPAISPATPSSFSEDRTLTVKQFLFEKKPTTDIERVACLAYYLTHYRNTPHFKTLDISKLNTDAAQIKFANAANAVGNAMQAGLIAPAGGENRQISAGGERYVQELPDRIAAKAAIAGLRKRRSKKSEKQSGAGLK